jgi:hypothetical protein
MILISHRGNLNSKNKELENSPDYIIKALDKYEVEIDVWFIDNNFFLGHDEPTYLTNINFLKNKKLWCHAKNLEALKDLLKLNIHCFWHEEDTVTLTSKNFIWTYPNKKIINYNSIAVMPELFPEWDISNASGICSDFIENYG